MKAALAIVAPFCMLTIACSSDPAVQEQRSIPSTAPSSTTAILTTLDGVSACWLITDSQAAMLGYLKKITPDVQSPQVPMYCGYESLSSSARLTISLPGKGRNVLARRPIDTATEEIVGRHRATKIQSSTDIACTIVIGVSETSRVDVYVGGLMTVADSCAQATEVAELIEPSLP